MKNNNLILSLATALLLATSPAKAQTNEVQLDADGIMRVGAPVRIVTIGNSITAGYSNTSPYWAWPAQMGRMLGPDYEVRNYAVSGTTMNIHVNSSFRNTGNYPKAKAANPDILVIAHGTNDAHVGWWKEWGHLFCDDYKSMVASFRDGGRNPILYCTLAPPVFGRSRADQNKNIEQEVIPRVKQVAAEVGATTIDFHTPFVGRNACFPDNVHPSDPTAEQMAEIVKSAILPQQKLTSQVKVKKGTVVSPTMAVVEPGSSVTLMPSAPSKGSWLWSGPNGFTSTKRALKLKKLASGGIYTVCFQDEAGGRSVLRYLVSIRGQKAGTITPHVSVSGSGWQETTSLTVRPGQDVNFGPSCSAGNDEGTWSQTDTIAVKRGTPVTFAPHPTNGKWEWTGPNGFHSNERHNQIFDFDVKMEGEYIGTYTNEAGCREQLTITLKLKE